MTESNEARILTVRNPWAWAIIHAGKAVENRSRNVAGDYRGPLLIHVAKQYAVGWRSPLLAGLMNQHDGIWEEPQPWRDRAGMIIGVVDLVDVHDGADESLHTADGEVIGTRACSPWAEPNAHHLVLENPRALDQPIPYTGALGLRRTDFFVSGDWLGQYIDPGHSSCTPYGCPPSCYSEPAARLVPTGPRTIGPDCRDGKCAACVGDAWDVERDEPTACQHGCHLDPTRNGAS